MSENAFTWPGQRQDDPGHCRLAEFLVMDVQQSPDWTKDLLDKTSLVQSGSLDKWERVGNAFCLSLSSEGAKIEDLVDENSSAKMITLAEFSQAVRTWLQHIERLEQFSP